MKIKNPCQNFKNYFLPLKIKNIYSYKLRESMKLNFNWLVKYAASMNNLRLQFSCALLGELDTAKLRKLMFIKSL